MMTIDGSQHSGSGTIVRYAVALAALLREPVRIINVRENRAQRGPERAPSANAYAERLSGRSRKNVSIASFQFVSGTSGTSSQFVDHYHRERNHHGLANRLIAGAPVIERTGRVRCRRRLGGLLNFYNRAA
jgi:hypothetical protein